MKFPTGKRSRINSVGKVEETVWLSVQFPGEVKQGSFPSPDELVLGKLRDIVWQTSLAETPDLRFERIVAVGQSRSPNECELPYNQLVVVLEGEVGLELADQRVRVAAGTERLPGQGVVRLLEKQKVTLLPGDFIWFPPNTPGRVEWTKPDGKTVMLSAYFGGKVSEAKPLRH